MWFKHGTMHFPSLSFKPWLAIISACFVYLLSETGSCTHARRDNPLTGKRLHLNTCLQKVKIMVPQHPPYEMWEFFELSSDALRRYSPHCLFLLHPNPKSPFTLLPRNNNSPHYLHYLQLPHRKICIELGSVEITVILSSFALSVI
jgi:hypothetical protein